MAGTETPTTNRYPSMAARALPGGRIGVTITGTEYALTRAEANELIGMIHGARHERERVPAPENWLGITIMTRDPWISEQAAHDDEIG